VTWRATRGELPGWARPALALWLGALLASWWPPLIVLGIVAAVLLAVGKIHGAALGAGLLLVPRRRTG